ncbi:hypothetical protein DAEQUDRAFT_233105 [Daedalea quercina L-15889]|uniref:Uncharacterized protein n=1 Tax=Daedalea quercina L-15889 TaxID=1314783 RepID=A0A165QUI7_9APHY|nr:hypothetical protein DAEQUDRAFT_233105 [Daedalea quercina L-15889]
MHGQREARLDRQKSMYPQPSQGPSFLLRCISPVFFNFPLQYLGELENIWVDRTVNYKPWRMFITNLQKDWENSITPATVLLTANVGLLAIQSIDTGHADRSMAQIASYISTFLSLGNIILCTVLARQHRLDAHMTAESAATYLDRRTRMRGGLEIVAVSFSLPSALFLWGMGAFYVAIAWVCLAGTSFWTRLLSGSIFFITTLFVCFIVVFDLWSAQSTLPTTPRLLERILSSRTIMREAFGSCFRSLRTRRSGRTILCVGRRNKRRGTDVEMIC